MGPLPSSRTVAVFAFVALTALVLATMLEPVGAVASEQEPAVEAGDGDALLANPNLLVIHDSVALGARTEISGALRGWDVEYLGFHGFQPWAASNFLRQRTAPIPDVVVVSLGNFNNRSNEQFRIDVRRLLGQLSVAERVIWVLPGHHRHTKLETLAALRELIPEHRGGELADWNPILDRNPGFVDFLGVHLTPDGADGFAKLVKRHVDGVAAGDRLPVGRLEVATSDIDGEVVAGWAIDVDSETSLRVRLIVDGRVVSEQVAQRRRQALQRRFGLGVAHGFRFVGVFEEGTHEVCVVAHDSDGRGHRRIGCRTLTVERPPGWPHWRSHTPTRPDRDDQFPSDPVVLPA